MGAWLRLQLRLILTVVTVATDSQASRRVAMTTSLLATATPRQRAVSSDTLIRHVSDNKKPLTWFKPFSVMNNNVSKSATFRVPSMRWAWLQYKLPSICGNESRHLCTTTNTSSKTMPFQSLGYFPGRRNVFLQKTYKPQKSNLFSLSGFLGHGEKGV